MKNEYTYCIMENEYKEKFVLLFEDDMSMNDYLSETEYKGKKGTKKEALKIIDMLPRKNWQKLVICEYMELTDNGWSVPCGCIGELTLGNPKGKCNILYK